MGLFLHFRASGQTLFREPSVMQLAFAYCQVRNMVVPTDMIGFKAEGTDLPWRTDLMSGVAKNSLGRSPDHRAPPVLAYKFSSFSSPAFAISRMADASAKSSWRATRTPRHLASKASALSLPRRRLSRSW